MHKIFLQRQDKQSYLLPNSNFTDESNARHFNNITKYGINTDNVKQLTTTNKNVNEQL